MDEKEFNNTYAIPANYTDSGKLLGGMLETRNTIEAIVMLGLVGYPEVAWLHVDTTVKVVIMTVTLIPLGVVSLMGIGGGSPVQKLRPISLLPDAIPQPHRKVRLEPQKTALQKDWI